ncbi:hypothetical protein HYW87_00940 [Candidatus Roizmanbacteria bacterium]|nr:hypothetical protein [Candidatus Roizmanbacteria bacterium]
MKIVYTKHAIKKFKDLKALKVIVRKSHIKQAIEKPKSVDDVTDFPKKIASIDFGPSLILRVVYREENGKIIIITFYPGKKGRYV